MGDDEDENQKMVLEIVKSKQDAMKPFLLKLGVALALTVAGCVYSHFRYRKIRPRLPPRSPGGRKAASKDESRVMPPSPMPGSEKKEAPQTQKDLINTTVGISPSNKNSGDAEGFLLPEFNEIVQEFDACPLSPTIKEMEIAASRKADEEMKAMEQEIINLQNLVRVLREREKNLEIQLLEYYGLKEQEAAVRELQNRLKINAMEAQLFTLKIEQLQADNRRLEAQVAEHSKVIAELESARAKIKQLKRKMKSDSEQAKEQLSVLHQRVAALKEQEYRISMNDTDIQKQQQKIKELEDELAELRRSNLRLQNENSELAMKLESTQILASSILEGPEAQLLEETKHLRQANEDLEKEIENMRTGRCADLEELVYLRWVNACLRYELRNYQPPPGKTIARDLSKTLSPRSEEKAKQLIVEYANSGIDETAFTDFDTEYSSSSQASTTTDMCDYDDTSLDVSSSTRNSRSSKQKFFSKLKKIVLRRESHGNIHRISSADKNLKSGGTSERRPSVSLDDSIRRCSHESVSSCVSVENATINQTPLGTNSFHNSTISKGMQLKSGECLDTTKQSQNNARLSFDMQRLRNLNPDELKDTSNYDSRINDAVPLHECKRMVLGEGDAMEFIYHGDCQPNHERDTPERQELMKYAQALQRSHGIQKAGQRLRSASFSFL